VLKFLSSLAELPLPFSPGFSSYDDVDDHHHDHDESFLASIGTFTS